MKRIRIILGTIIAFVCMNTNAEDPFRLNASSGQMKTVNITRSFDRTQFIPFTTEQKLVGLSISGCIEKKSTDYVVRVILIDTKGHEYMILESYDLINSEQNIPFDNYCEETQLLFDVFPQTIKVVTKGAEVKIDKISYIDSPKISAELISNEQEKIIIKKKQVHNIIDRINKNNRKQQKLWIAGETPLSTLCFEEKKKRLRLTDETFSYGFEYYVGGIFDAGDFKLTGQIKTASQYVECFDWRDRHGINWLNSVKDQNGSAWCMAFATAGTMEARMNLYYNRKLNLDLSAQHIATCAQRPGFPSYYNGLWYEDVLPFIKNEGVYDANSYPQNISPNALCYFVPSVELVRIASYTEIRNEDEDDIKQTLIKDGPLLSGYLGHSMVLVGYGTIHEGDSIRISNGAGPGNHIYISSGCPYIGRTYWIYKNSYGSTSGLTTDEGYSYIIYNDMSIMSKSYRLNYPFSTLTYTNNDIVCEDKDGDGYYFWGLGAKPFHCPSWVPDTPDGDDSDINHGPLDSYGNLDILPAGITIQTSVIYASNSSTSYRLGIVNGGRLTITGTTTLIGDSKIRVCEGGILVVDGGTLLNADITMVPGSTLIIRNGGVINMASGKEFKAPSGVIVNIESGEIN